jgi:NitT/TauT family transport system substrate-binding protein
MPVRRLWWSLALLCAFALACGSPGAPAPDGAPAAGSAGSAAAPPAPVAMRFGVNTTGPQATPAWVAKDEGFFEKYGIDAELVVVASAAQLAPALISGEIPIAIGAATGFVSSALAGSDLVLLGGYANQLQLWLSSQPEITSVEELRGQKIAITRRGSATHMATRLVLQRHGLDVDRDVTLIQTGVNSLEALLAGSVNAAMMGPPNTFVAEDQGMRTLVDVGEYNYPLIQQGIAASRAWVARNEDLTRRTLQAFGEGIAFAQDQKARTKAIIGKYTKTDDQQMVERAYNAFVPRWDRTMYAPPEALRPDLEALADELPAARDAQPEQFVDNRFVLELERSGFFQRLPQ